MLNNTENQTLQKSEKILHITYHHIRNDKQFAEMLFLLNYVVQPTFYRVLCFDHDNEEKFIISTFVLDSIQFDLVVYPTLIH